jgi:phosphoglycerate dehydrogenase-like enzyme
MKTVAYDPYPDSRFAPGDGFRYAPLEEVFAEADFLSLHCPPSPDGRPLLDATSLQKLKRGVFLINTARCDVMDTDAILAALDTGEVAGLALDVFDTEPPTDARLALHSLVISTPHIGGFTRESIDRAMSIALENLLTGLGSPTQSSAR